MQEQLMCYHVPIRGYLVEQPDGSYELDPERSTYADIPADAIARFLIEKLAPGALSPGGDVFAKGK